MKQFREARDARMPCSRTYDLATWRVIISRIANMTLIYERKPYLWCLTTPSTRSHLNETFTCSVGLLLLASKTWSNRPFACNTFAPIFDMQKCSLAIVRRNLSVVTSGCRGQFAGSNSDRKPSISKNPESLPLSVTNGVLSKRKRIAIGGPPMVLCNCCTTVPKRGHSLCRSSLHNDLTSTITASEVC